MAIRRYVAATTREAMLQVRRELGEDAVILSSKRVGNRLEILAAAPDAVEALVERSEARAAAAAPAREPPPREPARPKIESFQDYLRRQSQADGGRAAGDGRPRAADVAMYEDVAQIRDEETPPARQTAATAPADAAAASPRPAVASAAPRAQPHRAPQIEPPAPPQPAVFRRRPAVVAPVAQPAAHPSTPPQPAT
ncbi:MAG: hypothetical protein N2688_10175, partial [Burkholderiaceae bacterium]|nr:hypothetical protein [Burkholderiaceae bacterium]